MRGWAMVRPVLASCIATSAAGSAGAQPIDVAIDASRTGAPISPLIYGQFTENANNNFYRGGLWAEMLEDRKFYYPVATTAPVVPLGEGGRNRTPQAWWRPVGGGVVAMDRQHAYSGRQSARVALDPATARGIAQSGLAIQQGRAYTGRVVIAADPGTDVQVSLIWGAGAGERQTIRIAGVTRDYRAFPIAFTGGADAAEATIEIVASGTGSLNIGAVSLMPADNVEGWRADALRALREIGPTIIRYGGNFISDYDWTSGVGERDRRPSTFDFAWIQMDPNDVGTEEILTLARLLGAEPYMNVNAGFGDAASAARWLEYCNGAATTPMGRLRAANGHPEPYAVKWWNIGNEMYGPWQLGQMQMRQYAIKHNFFAAAMRQVDPSITIVAVGATPAELGTSGAARAYGKPVVEFGDASDWDSIMLTNAGNFDYLAEHLYPRGAQAFDAASGKFAPVEEAPEDHARRLPNRVKLAVEAWQEYQRRFPALDMRKIKIALDEWVPGGTGGARNPMYTALSSAEALHEIFRNSDWFVLANFTHLTGLVTGRTSSTILPVGRMFELYRRHFGTIPVQVSGTVPQRAVKGTVGVDLPKVSSGSDTYPLDIAAAMTADRKTLTVAVVNATQSDQRLRVSFKGATVKGGGRLLRIVAPAGAGATAGTAPIPATAISETKLQAIPAMLAIPRESISLYEVAVGAAR